MVSPCFASVWYCYIIINLQGYKFAIHQTMLPSSDLLLSYYCYSHSKSHLKDYFQQIWESLFTTHILDDVHIYLIITKCNKATQSYNILVYTRTVSIIRLCSAKCDINNYMKLFMPSAVRALYIDHYNYMHHTQCISK